MDPDWYSDDELKRLGVATKVILHGAVVTVHANDSIGANRWKTRPKLHQVYHLNKNAQRSRRPIRASSPRKEEEGMGKLSNISCGVHGANVARRALQRWCVQFFEFHDPDNGL